jgi:predicted nucleic acid-binding protein
MSGFLLDTNIISELVKPRPEPAVVGFVSSTDETLLFLSVLTMGEIRKGIACLPRAGKRALLESWLDSELAVRFAGRILDINGAVADRWGWIAGRAAAAGTTVSVIDSLLAATALHHNLTFVTRNSADVSPTGVRVFNPWLA